jgi:hypothetical protein
MLVFRSFAIGLLAACFALLVMRPPIVRVVQQPVWLPPTLRFERPAPEVPVPTIIDAAPGISAAQLALTIRLAPGEHIAAIDDTRVAGEINAGLVLASRDLRSRQFIDFTVAGPRGDRRVLVLMH